MQVAGGDRGHVWYEDIGVDESVRLMRITKSLVAIDLLGCDLYHFASELIDVVNVALCPCRGEDRAR